MNSDERLDYLKYRLESAYKTYEAANMLAENQYWNSAVNRLYYAVFYAVNALLVSQGIMIKSHAGLITQFSLHFIKTKKIDKKYGQLLTKLYDWRQKGDYEKTEEYRKEDVEPLIPEVKQMIDMIKDNMNIR